MKKKLVVLSIVMSLFVFWGCDNPLSPEPVTDELMLSSLTSSAVVLIPKQEKDLGLSALPYLATVSDEKVALINEEGLLLGVASGETTIEIADAEGSLLFSVDVVVSTRFETSDSVFEGVLLEDYDADEDGIFTLYEAQKISALNLDQLQISDLTGIKSFIGLKVLSCVGNQFTALDVAGMSLQSLNLKDCTSLMTLDCSDNEIAWLDLTGAALLQTADLSGNQIPALNLQGCTLLETLDASNNLIKGNLAPEFPYLTELDLGQNLFRSLDVSNLPELKQVRLNSIPTMVSATGFYGEERIYINSCEKLTSISGGHVDSLTVRGCSALTTLAFNRTPSITIENCSSLVSLNLTSDVATPVERRLTSLVVNNCPRLGTITAAYHSLTQLSFTGVDSLTTLDIQRNYAKSLVIDKIPSLQTLYTRNSPYLKSLTLWPGYESLVITKDTSTVISVQ